ncbi:MAG TPA: SpoIIE family protein phosphatase [Baekduia sp.]|nr:SpoIIE family protein phosphatase [Baekduia sp.]
MALTALRLRVEDPSGVAPCRRAAERLAADLGFDPVARGEAAIVVTELATNLVRHAGGGEIVLRGRGGPPQAIDAVAWDTGPGLGDVARSLRDGFSTAGGSGTGLGAIGRLSAVFDLQSTAGHGAVLVARLGTADVPSVDGLALAMAGEEASGDGWAHVLDGDVATIAVIDGLGHGLDAAHASSTALRELRPGLAPEELLERMHGALRPTRGAAGAVVRLDLRSGELRFAGIGNIAAVAVTGTHAKALASLNGTLGHRVQRIQAYEHQLAPGGLLVLHSDGLRSGWDLAAHPGLQRRDPLVIAALLIRDFERGRDDVSAVVARTAREP